VRQKFCLGSELDRNAVPQLNPGAVMTLARPLEEGVDIVVDGVRIDRGQITTIGDAIGVRVTRL
jgi:flagellar motor switch/type III secretory pathway protein FliN